MFLIGFERYINVLFFFWFLKVFVGFVLVNIEEILGVFLLIDEGDNLCIVFYGGSYDRC